LYDRNLFKEAIPFYKDDAERGKGAAVKSNALVKLANCYRLTGEFELAEETYKKIFKNKKKDPQNALNYAHSLKSSAKYAEAKEAYREYAKLNPSDPMGTSYVQSCDSAQMWLDETIGQEAKNIEIINTTESDFASVFYQDGIIFCSSRPGGKKPLVTFNGGIDVTKLDLYYSPVLAGEGNVTAPINMKQINSAQHEGPATTTADGRTIYFTRTVNGARDKAKNAVVSTLQVFVSKLDSLGKWSKPVSAFTFNSQKYSVAHPSVSQDGRRIYFMSDMPGGQGGTDIYYCDMNPNGTHGSPVNLGAPVNTFGNELFPFICGNGKLYFSSNAHIGMGKLDVFSATYSNGKWGNVSNMKPPINSIADDFAICLDNAGVKGFFSSDRFNGKGGDDIYSFILNPPLELFINGGLVQIPDNSLFDGLKYKLVEEESQEEKVLDITPGKYYSFRYVEGKKYILSARKDGLTYNKIEFSLARNLESDYLTGFVKSKIKPIYVKGLLSEPLGGADSLKPEKPVTAAEVLLRDSLVLIGEVATSSEGLFDWGKILQPDIRYRISAPRKVKKVVNSTLCKGVVYGDDKKPLDDVLLKLLEGDDIINQQKTPQGAAGSYKFKLEGNKDYTILAEKEGYNSTTVKVSSADFSNGDILKDIVLVSVGKVQLQGVLKDSAAPIANAQVVLSKDQQVVDRTTTSSSGGFDFALLPEKKYVVTATAKGYFQKEVEVSTVGKKAGDVIKSQLKLDTLVAEKAVEIKNIYYDYNKANIRFSSYAELDKLVEFLKTNPTLVIELSAHCDNRGDDTYNMRLSQERADYVRGYLILEEINKSRIIAKGYGESKPVVANAKTEDEHQLNRRTEFKIISINPFQ
jgi:outer membrane protein OmpA-like peptidoglycan-associated protein